MDINTSYSNAQQLYAQRSRTESTTPTLEEAIEQQNAAFAAQAQTPQTANNTANIAPAPQINAISEQNTALQSSINGAKFANSNVLQNEQMLKNVLNIL